MATSVGTADHQTLNLVFEDFRTQTARRKVTILGTLTNVQIQAICDALDAASNCKITASVETSKPITGFKGSAVNALERNISEVMLLAFDGVDDVSNNAVIRTFAIPAMAAADELTGGSPNTADPTMAALITALEAGLIFKKVDDTFSGAVLTLNPDASHHITIADVVDVT